MYFAHKNMQPLSSHLRQQQVLVGLAWKLWPNCFVSWIQKRRRWKADFFFSVMPLLNVKYTQQKAAFGYMSHIQWISRKWLGSVTETQLLFKGKNTCYFKHCGLDGKSSDDAINFQQQAFSTEWVHGFSKRCAFFTNEELMQKMLLVIWSVGFSSFGFARPKHHQSWLTFKDSFWSVCANLQ